MIMKALKLSLIAAAAAALVGGISVSQAVAEQPSRDGSYVDRESGTWGYYPHRYDYYDRYGRYDRRYHTYGYTYNPYYYDRYVYDRYVYDPYYYDYGPDVYFGFGFGAG
jgi:hypothetical protein